MARFLFRLGRWSFVHRRIVAATWVMVLGGLVLGNAALAKPTTSDFELNGIESTQAFELIKERSPEASPDGASALVVFEAKPGHTLTEGPTMATVQRTLQALTTVDVTSVGDPYRDGTISQDGTVAYSTVDYAKPATDLTVADKDALKKAESEAEAAGLKVAIGGDAAEDDGGPPLAELLGIAVALLVLTITLGSMLAAGMPLITAIIGVGIGVMAIGTLSGFVQLGSTTPALGTMLGLAVGIDYALFIMSRYRHEVRDGQSLEDAAGRAVGTAGSAVIFAGLTVVIALAGLSVCGIPFLTQLGLAGAGMVALSVLIALTLLPALMGFAGPRITSGGIRFLKNREKGPEDDQAKITNGRRWVELVTRFRVPALVAGVATAAVVSIPLLSMQLALPDAATDPAGSGSRTAYDLISENFGEGTNGPLIVVVDTAAAQDPVSAVNQAVADLQSIGNDVAAVVPPAAEAPQPQSALAQQLSAVQFATITVVPATGPSDQATKALVDRIRERLSDLPEQTGARALVTGQTAVGVDIAEELNRVFPLYLAVVVGLAFVLLVVVFRSIWVPLKAAAGFLLSVGASLGATVAVFQWGWLHQLLGLDTTSPVLFLLPLMLTGILFGLAMDYEVFLVTRMREAHIHGEPARKAVVIGFQHSARVVVAAAVIMIGVFAGFALVDDVTLKTIGFALAFGVLVDAFLVRMTIVPALMSIVGERIWWLPRWLDRIIPDLDIEGDRLARTQEATAVVPVPEDVVTAAHR